MYTKAQKTKLIKICKVLFPEYKKVYINRHSGNAMFYRRTSKEFLKYWKLSLIELLQFQLPQKLTLFKYGNSTFMNVVIEELIRCDINQQDRLDYFYNELVQSKFSEVYDQLQIEKEDFPIKESCIMPQKELLNDIVISYSVHSKNYPTMKITDYTNIIGKEVVACLILSLTFVSYLIFL